MQVALNVVTYWTRASIERRKMRVAEGRFVAPHASAYRMVCVRAEVVVVAYVVVVVAEEEVVSRFR